MQQIHLLVLAEDHQGATGGDIVYQTKHNGGGVEPTRHNQPVTMETWMWHIHNYKHNLQCQQWRQVPSSHLCLISQDFLFQ